MYMYIACLDLNQLLPCLQSSTSIVYTCTCTCKLIFFLFILATLCKPSCSKCLLCFNVGTTSGPPPATGARPVIGSYSAVWPGVIFPRKHTREEATQVIV